jgi:hypothetical protein
MLKLYSILLFLLGFLRKTSSRLRGIIEIANNKELGLEMCNGMAVTMREAKPISKRSDDISQSTK